MKIMYKIAAIIALLIGIMSVISGSLVLLNYNIPNYNVLNWLVIYNVIFGAISMLEAYFIWKNKSLAKNAVVFILAAHTFIAIYLNFFSETVASESIKAMSFRISIWILIYLLTYKKFNKQSLNITK
ncbi:MAG: hypothetical protein Q7U59_03990 [Lutibacter sp.]|nr:hypothetical protein [Lutibacter sp.]